MKYTRGILLATVIMASACTPDAPPRTNGTPSACAPTVRTGPLPEWARAGFSGDAAVPHVLGERGDIVGVLFGHPLRQPPEEGRNNKILWVSRPPVAPGDPLVIDARLGGTGPVTHRQVDGGPGPSIVDMPEAGCWVFTLAWSSYRDSVTVVYAKPSILRRSITSLSLEPTLVSLRREQTGHTRIRTPELRHGAGCAQTETTSTA